ncbi:hypothetical protein SDC9_145992 [bioreactor metagenome]|uniref:Peptidoglycan binding-like domain-containing protein n=1 Tax=bioreactor metagenome TaxID=1076179 RepID=A0A645EDY1_9ZZZZ
MINLINTIFVPIKSLKEDGGFGALTEASVMEFQKIYNYIADGIVSRQTWNRLTSTYNEVASKCIFSDRTCVGTKSYAGTPLKRGSAGNEVRYIQARLKLIYQYLPIIGEVEIDSIFGAQTEKTVMSIQRLFGLVPDGIVGQTTFNLINYIYCASDYGCLSKPSASGISVISEADLPVSTDPDEEPETSAEWEDIQESNQ